METWPPEHTVSLFQQPIDWKALCARWEWLRNLQQIPQNPDFHGEGDVLAHTRMVVEALPGLQRWEALSLKEQNVLSLAALLHDLGKGFCTQVDEHGGITTHGHARKGAQRARTLLWQGIPEPVPFQEREQIVTLIRSHSLPLWLLERADALRPVLHLSLTTKLSWLAFLAEADVRGRICGDMDDLLTRVELFREFCHEHRCYESPYPFQSPAGRFLYSSGKSSSPDYQPYDDPAAFDVILMSGLPGSGKDTWIQENAAHLPVVSLDGIREATGTSPAESQGRVVQAAKEQARQLLRKKQPFVWNATNISQRLREQLVRLFTNYGAQVTIVYVETEYQTLLQRNSQRTEKEKIPDNVLKRFIHNLDVPNAREAHHIRYVMT